MPPMQYKPIMSYDDFLIAVDYKQHLMAGEWRYGQTYFNILRAVAPEIADELRGGPHDTFFREKIPPLTHLHVRQMWQEYRMWNTEGAPQASE